MKLFQFALSQSSPKHTEWLLWPLQLQLNSIEIIEKTINNLPLRNKKHALGKHISIQVQRTVPNLITRSFPLVLDFSSTLLIFVY